jgi:hypothetical protein
MPYTLRFNWAPRHECVLRSGGTAPRILGLGPAALPPGKEPLVHIGQEAGWAPESVWVHDYFRTSYVETALICLQRILTYSKRNWLVWNCVNLTICWLICWRHKLWRNSVAWYMTLLHQQLSIEKKPRIASVRKIEGTSRKMLRKKWHDDDDDDDDDWTRKENTSTCYNFLFKVGHNIKLYTSVINVRVCIPKFPDWPPGARTANGRALCH